MIVGAIDEKYYLSDKMKQYISKKGTNGYTNPDCKINKIIARPITTDPNKRAGTTNYISRDVGDEFDLNEENVKQLRIRKLTPKECWRLMGFKDESFEKAQKVNSNTQLYKQAGNSIVVNVLEKIIANMNLELEHIKLLELFGGICACSEAMKNLGLDFEIADYVEIDKYAVASYNAINGTNFEPQDICEWNKDMEVNFIMHGSPCFLRNELVNTKNGFKKIQNIEVGDYVKSHDGTYNKVIQIMKNKNDYIFDINCSAVHNINTTFNHPFYVLRNNKPQYIIAKDLIEDDYMMIPINKTENEIKWNGVIYNYNNRTKISNNLPFNKKEFWYLIGRFIGDGWVTRRKDRNNNISGIKVCCGKSELKEFEDKLNDVLPYTLIEDRTVYKLQFSNKELGVFCEQFGTGAKNKQIPQNILDLKNEYLYPLLDGIIDSDGCFTENRYKVTSISKKLVYNIGELILKLYKIPYHIYGINRPNKYIIENRIVNQNKTYQITWGGNINKNINYVDEDYLYSKIRNIKSKKELCTVYNIEVENTHSYCVYNIATHNCQDFSLAGKQAGGDEGSGTRSSLMYETIRIVEKLKPKYVLWENVKNVIGKKHIHNFENYLNRMSELGYKNYYQVLNAKDYGIPQNRERVFTLSILDGTKYEFPPKQELKLKLKDILEDIVEEKYYLSDKQVERIRKSTYNTSKTRIQEPIACEIRYDEGIRTFKDNVMGSLRTIDACGDKCIIEKNKYDFSDLD